jgi:colanic acid biosynthesis glycosyl transferase WcaI
MRILILSQHFPPEPVTRLRDLTQHLVARGHDVSVVTTFPSYPLGHVYNGYHLGLCTRYSELGATITRVFALPYRGVAKSKRILSYFSFAVMALLIGLLPRRRPDVAYVYHPPLTTGLTAALYNLVARVPFVYDVQDIWPEALVAAGLLQEGSITYRGIRFVENLVYHRANHINVISSGMRCNLISKGIPEEKITVISSWGDPNIYRPGDGRDLRLRLGWRDRFVVMAAGNMGLTHGLETVIEAAARLQDNPYILFVFLGSGVAKPALMTETAIRRLSNVVFYDQVPEVEAAQFINAADVMLVHLKPGPKDDFSVPHRIFSYMLCGKPIIAAATGSTANLVESLRCGWVCPPSNPAALAEVVRRAAADPVGCQHLGQNGPLIAHSTYSRSYLLGQIEPTIIAACAR